MKQKRLHVRLPLNGDAVLSDGSNPIIKASTINISLGGVAIVGFPKIISPAEYQIKILTEVGQEIEIFAQLVQVDDSIAGFQTLRIDQKSQEIIKELVFEYQQSIDFIKQLDEFNLHKVLDEEGNEIEITFENDF